jgi:glycosyltransferase involved in cell wall biosynthesis
LCLKNEESPINCVVINPKISIIIPTHNRANSLSWLLKNIFVLNENINFEIVVVDNNSKDETKDIVKNFSEKVRYVFEPSTSFTKARYRGAQAAKGDILLYLDDDVIVNSGTLKEVVRIFSKHSKCAVAGGKILPSYEQSPPSWVLDLQKKFNGFSLYDCGNEVKKVDSVPGPIMAISKKVFFEVGGFPPDTIGVETNSEKKTFKKLYVGPGDYGLCLLCRKAGYEVIYSPAISVYHSVPPFRLTKEFWLSRMIGEGHSKAVTMMNMEDFKLTRFEAMKNRCSNKKNLFKHFVNAKIKRLKGCKEPLLYDEVSYEYYKAFIGMESILRRDKTLAKYLWKLGYEGVSDKNFDVVLSKLPKAYQKLAM